MRGCGLAAWLLAFAPVGAAAEPCAPAAVHLVRHAEKAVSADADFADPDPELSEEGRASAAALATWFDGKTLDAIYATHLRRTQQTALPLAAARDLDLRVLPAADTTRLLQRLHERHCGQQVLVIGHSNTVPEIAVALGAEPFAIGESDYDQVYTVVPGSGAMQRDDYAAKPVSP